MASFNRELRAVFAGKCFILYMFINVEHKVVSDDMLTFLVKQSKMVVGSF